jgi:hypothetical protein
MSVTTSIYNALKNDVLTKAVSLTADTIKCALFDNSGSFTATDTTYGTTNELATANGYTQGGATLANKAVSGTTTVKWTADATQWTATGAGFSAYHAKLYSTTNSSRLIAHINFGGVQTASGGGTFTITWDAGGIFTLA